MFWISFAAEKNAREIKMWKTRKLRKPILDVGEIRQIEDNVRPLPNYNNWYQSCGG